MLVFSAENERLHSSLGRVQAKQALAQGPLPTIPISRALHLISLAGTASRNLNWETVLVFWAPILLPGDYEPHFGACFGFCGAGNNLKCEILKDAIVSREFAVQHTR